MQFEGIAIFDKPNPALPGRASATSIVIMEEYGAYGTWLNLANPQGTITILGPAD